MIKDMQNVYINFFKYNHTIKQYGNWWQLVIGNSSGGYYYNYCCRVEK